MILPQEGATTTGCLDVSLNIDGEISFLTILFIILSPLGSYEAGALKSNASPKGIGLHVGEAQTQPWLQGWGK